MPKKIALVIFAFLSAGIIYFAISCGDDSVNPLGGDTGIQDTSLRTCKNNAQCNADEECKNNVCVKKETVVCRNKTDCKANQDCIGGKCVDVTADAGLDGGLDTGDSEIVKKGKITAEPLSVEFGAMRFGEKRERIIKVRNSGNADLKVLKVELDANADPTVFSFKTDFVFGSMLKPDSEFEIVAYCQQNDEAPDSGDLLISSDDTDMPILRIKMKNSYKDQPELSVTYLNDKNEEVTYPSEGSVNNELSFSIGNIPLGEKKVQIINLINVASESILKITEVKFDIYNNNSNNINKFSAVLKDKVDGSEINLPVYLSPSDTVVLLVEYVADNEATEDKYSISVKTNDPDINNDNDPKEDGLLIINLSALAGYRDPSLAVLDLNDKDILSTGIDFGEVEKDISSKKLFKICNKGGGFLKIDKSSALKNGNFNLNPSNLEASLKYEQCINNIEIEFVPKVVGEVKDILAIISNDPTNPNAELNIRGLGINSEMRVNPLSVDFGDVLINSEANPVDIEIKNIGDGTLNIYKIEFGSGSSKDFSLSNLPPNYPLKLKSNESTYFSVRFKPTSLGVKSAAVVISSSDAENLNVQIPISGNGSNCDSDHADCNNDASDGCEIDLRTDIANCGGCNNICNPPNANPICENKKCKIESCKGSYLDCDNDLDNGCESDKLTDNNNCGTCFTVCGDQSSCQNGNCACYTGYLNCDNNFANGCEVDKNNDPSNCGSCNYNCGPNSVCVSGNCGCVDNYKNCDGKLDNGCEVNIKTNVNNCGDCNIKCGLNALCEDGHCKCNDGYGNCNGDWFDGCEKYLMFDKNNCGLCSKVCPNPPNSTSSCNMGQCEFTCLSGYKDCDQIIDNGCESFVNTDPSNCGICGFKCGDNMECQNGFCVCKLGFADCDNNQANGCEVNLSNDNNNCGSCSNSCNNNASCINFNCSCITNYANCDTLWSNGCEVYLPTDLYNCGTCGKDCTTLQNVSSASCSNGNCIINSCNDHTANCDGNVNNGCEINHNSYANACATNENAGEICGDNGTPTLGSFEGIGSKWFKVKIKECDSGVFADTLAAQIYLDVPNAPLDYELFVYDACGTSGTSFPKGPGVDESIWVTMGDTQCFPSSCDDTFDLYIEVRYIGGGTNQCNKWYLTITSNDSWY